MMYHDRTEKPQLKEKVRHSEGQMPVKIYPCSYSDELTNILLHWHQEIEITLICSGRILYQIGSTELLVQEGDLLIISPCTLHSAKKLPEELCETESIVCDLQMFCSTAAEGAIYQLFLPIITQKHRFKTLIQPGDSAYELLRDCFCAATRCYYKRLRYWELLFKENMLHMIYLLLDHQYLQTARDLYPGSGNQKNEEMIRQILEYISDHSAENLSIKKLAAISKYSPSHFMKVFKQNTGITCNQFILQYRLNCAGTLLRESSQSITAVALSCGFNNLSYFIRCFHEQFHCTPTAYRKSYALTQQ